MKILIAPLHYIADREEGSEYTRAYDYISFISQQKNTEGDVLVGFMKEKRFGNFNIKSFFEKKPTYISNLTRLNFIFWVFFESTKLLVKKRYDIIWHNGPFAINETFSLIGLFNFSGTPFVVGPIVSPHNFIGSDESRSMGNKTPQDKGFMSKILKLFDNKTYFLSKIFSFLSNLTLKKASFIIAKETYGEKLLSEKEIKRIKTINMGINTDKFLKIKHKPIKRKFIKLLNVSYLVERKRTQDLIYAMDKLVNREGLKNYRLEIIGDGPQRQTLEDLTNRLNLWKYISFKGFVSRDKVHKFYQDADIFVSASISDSMPAMYFEAMAVGLPMVISMNNSSDELLKKGVGVFVSVPEDPNSMADQIIRLGSNKKKLISFGHKNFQLSKTIFNFNLAMKKFLLCLEETTLEGRAS